MADEVKVLVELYNDNSDEIQAYANVDGKIMFRDVEGIRGQNFIVDAKIVDDAEREAIFTSDDIEEE